MAEPDSAADQAAQRRTHDREDFARLMKFVADFALESDRAAVIVGAARIDESLYQLIGAFLLPATSSTDELLDSDRPLGTFSARIHIAHRLGLIDAELARALHLIRRIRNSFAHDATGATLESGGHADRIREVVRPLRRYRAFDEARDLIAKDHTGLSAEFRTVLAMLSTRLEHAAVGIQRVAGRPATFIPQVWTKEAEPANQALQPTDGSAVRG